MMFQGEEDEDVEDGRGAGEESSVSRGKLFVCILFYFAAL